MVRLNRIPGFFAGPVISYKGSFERWSEINLSFLTLILLALSDWFLRMSLFRLHSSRNFISGVMNIGQPSVMVTCLTPRYALNNEFIPNIYKVDISTAYIIRPLVNQIPFKLYPSTILVSRTVENFTTFRSFDNSGSKWIGSSTN